MEVYKVARLLQENDSLSINVVEERERERETETNFSLKFPNLEIVCLKDTAGCLEYLMTILQQERASACFVCAMFS